VRAVRCVQSHGLLTNLTGLQNLRTIVAGDLTLRVCFPYPLRCLTARRLARTWLSRAHLVSVLRAVPCCAVLMRSSYCVFQYMGALQSLDALSGLRNSSIGTLTVSRYSRARSP
jgi:hypothetical protein